MLKYKIGKIYTFKQKNKFFKIKAEVIDIYNKNGKLYLKLYLLFSREYKTFLINKKHKLINPKELPSYKNAPIVYNDILDDNKIKKTHPLLNKFILFIMLATFILTINPGLKLTRGINYSYEEFLKKDLSLSKLYDIVTTRLDYRYDIGDDWLTPKAAWDIKSGDCEEFTSIVADYLNHHNIENYLIGMDVKNSAEGHAVVIAKVKNAFYMIDPTKALEPFGIKKITKANNLKEVILIYTKLPAYIFKVPGFNGEKLIIKTIY